MYKFSVYDFSEKEIELLCQMVKNWSNGYIMPINRAKLTKQVERYTRGWHLVEMKEDKRLYYTSGSIFIPHLDLPVEALWRLVKPMLRTEGNTGYSIVNNPGWENLNIYPQNSRHASNRDLEEKIDILNKLASWGYIIFQFAGTVWSITTVERKVTC